MLRHLPNALTILRLLIAAVFPVIPAGAPRLLGVVVGALSDAIDGTIARRLHAQTWIGGILDGIADKAFALSILLTLTIEGALAWHEMALLLSRDIAVGVMALVVALERQWGAFRRMPARLGGKVATGMVFVVMISLLAFPRVAPIVIPPAIGASLLAALDYVILFAREHRVHRERESHERSGGE